MAKYGSKDITIEVDNSGGTPVDLSNYIDNDVEVAKKAITEETTAFGDTWEEHTDTELRRVEPITLEGYYDDTETSGPDAVLDSLGDTRTLTVTWGTNTTTVECIIVGYTPRAVRGGLTRFVCELQPTGAVS